MRVSDMELFHQREQEVVAVRMKVAPEQLPVEIGRAYAKLGEYLKGQGELMGGVPYVCYRNYKNQDITALEVEIGFPVARKIPGNGKILSVTIPECRAVFAMWRGAYGYILSIYEEMERWAKEKTLEPGNDGYEFYYNGPPFPVSEMITKVMIPLK